MRQEGDPGKNNRSANVPSIEGTGCPEKSEFQINTPLLVYVLNIAWDIFTAKIIHFYLEIKFNGASCTFIG